MIIRKPHGLARIYTIVSSILSFGILLIANETMLNAIDCLASGYITKRPLIVLYSLVITLILALNIAFCAFVLAILIK